MTDATALRLAKERLGSRAWIHKIAPDIVRSFPAEFGKRRCRIYDGKDFIRERGQGPTWEAAFIAAGAM